MIKVGLTMFLILVTSSQRHNAFKFTNYHLIKGLNAQFSLFYIKLAVIGAKPNIELESLNQNLNSIYELLADLQYNLINRRGTSPDAL